MKNFIVIFIAAVLLAMNSFGQLNPVNNLDWEHWYIMPNNYFILSWDEPEPSEDTLIGYNVYRENDLYCFTTDLSLYHTAGASNCEEDFVVYQGGMSFHAHVTAVYNSTLEESGYTETVYCVGLLIGIDTYKNPKPETIISPNPTNGIIQINLEDVNEVEIYSQTGELAFCAKQPESIDLYELPKGIYFIRVINGHQVFSEKVILQ